MKDLKAHLFVCTSCTYKKANGEESDASEAAVLRKNLKQRAREVYSKNEVRVSSTQCLGECEHGIAAVLYPKGEWMVNLRPSDEDKIFHKLTDEASRLK